MHLPHQHHFISSFIYITLRRHVIDGSAYVDGDTWQRILNHAKQDVVSVREG